ncbi:MAG: hypothetical protein WA994_13465 [Ornithinimicrobium sp.]
MTMPEASVIWLAVATALHAGFQLTVTSVVYPALVAVDAPDWTRAHTAHGRAITPVVVLTYGALLTAVAWSLWSQTSQPLVWISAGGAALSMSATAFVAAPTHSRLARQRDPALLRVLIVSDRVRAVGAVVALAAALAAVVAQSGLPGD